MEIDGVWEHISRRRGPLRPRFHTEWPPAGQDAPHPARYNVMSAYKQLPSLQSVLKFILVAYTFSMLCLAQTLATV